MKFSTRKYHNRTYLYCGIEFDSKLEGQRYLYLKSLEDEGKITNLRRQVKYELIPKQLREVVIQLKTKTRVETRVAENPVEYIADFVYEVPGMERPVIEDTKGFKTKDYIIKRKLMRFQGNPITEIKKPTETINGIREEGR